VLRRRDERREHGAAEGGDVGGRDDALAVERREVEDAVEGLLLPLELLGVAPRRGLVGGEPPAHAEGGQDGLAERRDGVLQARVVRRRVRVPHRRRALLSAPLLWRSLEKLSKGASQSDGSWRERRGGWCGLVREVPLVLFGFCPNGCGGGN